VAVPFYANVNHPEDLFAFQTIPQSGLLNRTSRLSAGKVVGGSSTVNGMAWDRGSKSDYDSWENLGNPGWNWDSMLTYFKKVSLHLSVDASLGY